MIKFGINKYFWIFLLILFIGLFFRAYGLDFAPPGLHPDEAMNGNEALFSPGQVFYQENAGREGLYVNCISLIFKLFEPSISSLRLTSAIFGFLTIIGMYFFSKELFLLIGLKSKNSKIASLFASFFLAISFWHVNFSRMGIRGVLLPFFLVFCFYFFFKGIRTNRLIDFLIAGIFLGLGFYGYSAFRMIVLIFPIPFLYYFFSSIKKQELKRFFFEYWTFCLVTIIILLPLLTYFWHNSDLFFKRFDEVSIFSRPNTGKLFFEGTLSHLLMFNFIGDKYNYNFSYSPQLLFPVGLLFLLGIFLFIRKCVRGFRKRNYRALMACAFVFVWFFVMLLPGIFSYYKGPSALRSIGTIPVAYVFSAYGAFYLFDKLRKMKFFVKRTIWLVILITLIGGALFSWQFYKYFYLFTNNPVTIGAFGQRIADIGFFLNKEPQSLKKYVVVNEGNRPVPCPYGPPLAGQTIMFLESVEYGKIRSFYLSKQEISFLANLEGDAVIIPVWPSDEIIKEIQAINPKCKLFSIDNFNKGLTITR